MDEESKKVNGMRWVVDDERQDTGVMCMKRLLEGIDVESDIYSIERRDGGTYRLLSK